MPFGPLKKFIRISPKKLLVMLGVSGVIVIGVMKYGKYSQRYLGLSQWQILACLLGIVRALAASAPMSEVAAGLGLACRQAGGDQGGCQYGR